MNTISYYLTLRQSDRVKQLTFEEICFGSFDLRSEYRPNVTDNTITYELDRISPKFVAQLDVRSMIAALKSFNSMTEEIRAAPRHSLYYRFYIPKRKEGEDGVVKWRQIDAPHEELMHYLHLLKDMLRTVFHATHHTAAFAYVENRRILDALRRHQQNKSKWYGKFDFSDFFGSHTFSYCMNTLAHIFPFCEVMKTKEGNKELRKALDLAFLDGRLPQGTPVSPMLTNIMMIPFDFHLSRALRDLDGTRYVYTRYADDIIISARYWFHPKKMENVIRSVVSHVHAPYRLNLEKTRYGSSSGSNWNLGLIINKENEITVGAERKKMLKTRLFNYAKDKTLGMKWSMGDIQTLLGQLSFVESIEDLGSRRILNSVSSKIGFDVKKSLIRDIKTLNVL